MATAKNKQTKIENEQKGTNYNARLSFTQNSNQIQSDNWKSLEPLTKETLCPEAVETGAKRSIKWLIVLTASWNRNETTRS